MLLTVITLFFLLLYAVLIYYYYHYWRKLNEFVPHTTFSKTFVSVIVAARNEERNIKKLLTALQNQTYPEHLYEVVIIDDFSTDGTADEVMPFLSEKVKMIQPLADKNTSSKKKAIEAGIEFARGELMIITDADCLPGEKWIETIARFYEERGAVFIAAPVAYFQKNTLLHIFQSLDFLTLQGITAASVHANALSMCNGANLAYTKQAFKAVNGFSGIDAVASGDDMLLMYKIWKRYPDKVQYIKNKNAIVQTEAMPTWRAFFHQRIRWASKTTYYDDWRIIVVLAFVYLFNLWFLVLAGATFLKPFYGWLALLFLLLKTIIEWPFVYSVAKFYNQQTLLKKFPLFQPLHIIHTVVIGLVSQFGKYEWKGRRTR